MIHPDLHQWQTAKKAALAIAANMKAEVIQTPDGKTKRVIINKRVIDCTSWYGAYCVLHRIRLDQITRHAEEPPMAIILPDDPPRPPPKKT